MAENTAKLPSLPVIIGWALTIAGWSFSLGIVYQEQANHNRRLSDTEALLKQTAPVVPLVTDLQRRVGWLESDGVTGKQHFHKLENTVSRIENDVGWVRREMEKGR